MQRHKTRALCPISHADYLNATTAGAQFQEIVLTKPSASGAYFERELAPQRRFAPSLAGECEVSELSWLFHLGGSRSNLGAKRELGHGLKRLRRQAVVQANSCSSSAGDVGGGGSRKRINNNNSSSDSQSESNITTAFGFCNIFAIR